MTTLFAIQIIVWFTLGVVGSYMIWIADSISYGRRGWCPTPKAIALMCAGGCIGPVMTLFGILYLIVTAACEFNDRFLRGTWWDRPICRKDD